MRTSWRKREAAGATWAEEEAAREDEETEPTLDAEGVGRQEQEPKEEKGGKWEEDVMELKERESASFKLPLNAHSHS